MPLIELGEDEYFPFLYVKDKPSVTSKRAFEVDIKTLSRWRRYEKTFNKWQNEMKEAEHASMREKTNV